MLPARAAVLTLTVLYVAVTALYVASTVLSVSIDCLICANLDCLTCVNLALTVLYMPKGFQTPRDMLPALMRSHGGLRPLHQKSTCLNTIYSRALCGHVTPEFGVNEGVADQDGAPRDILTALMRPYGGLRPFHLKSTCLHAIYFRALCGANLVTLPPNLG